MLGICVKDKTQKMYVNTMGSCRVIFLSLCLLVATQVNGHEPPPPSEAYQHARELSEFVHLYWNFTNDSVSFEVHGHTTGWVGIGFSSGGSMIGADIVVGWIESGDVKITDRHGQSTNSFPPLDPEQNLRLVSGREVEGWTIFKFTRDRAACEEDYDRPLTDRTERIIWAIGHSDPSGEDLSTANRHTYSDRGSVSLYLFHGNKAFPGQNFTGAEFNTFDVRTQNLALPTANTYYNCRIVKVPPLNETHHVVQMEPIIQRENIRNVHHMLLFTCPRSWEPDGVWQLENDVQCGSELVGRSPCHGLFVGWAVGGRTVVLPEETGIPVGGDSGPKYMLLETHYDNADGQEGIVDSSGMRFTYTSNLRRYDTGIFAVGQSVNGLYHYIPPGAESFTTKTPCPTGCVNSALTTGAVPNITIHHVLLHAHLAGRKMKLRHFRNGVELPYILSDEAYDFEYQEFVSLDPYVTLQLGDALQAECTYSTENRDYVTEGGDGTHQEMCFAYVSYYPAINWDGCFSFTQPQDSLDYFGISSIAPNQLYPRSSLKGYNVTSPDSLSGKNVMDVVSEYNWTKERVAGFERHLHRNLKRHFCITGSVIPSDEPVIKTNFTYAPPKQTCTSVVQVSTVESEIETNFTYAPPGQTTSGSVLVKRNSARNWAVSVICGVYTFSISL